MRVLPLALLLAALALPARAEPLAVHAVTAPLAHFAERLAGEAAAVVFPVPADRDPAFWRPAIADIAAVQAADLILLNGAGYAAWTARTSLPRARLVDTSAGFAERYIATETVTHSHGPDGAHSHTGTASHTWLDFSLAARQARAVAEALSARLPGEAAAIAERLAALEAELAALDARARAAGARLAGVAMIASHPRYQYLARAYELEIASLEWEAGAVPSAEDWAALDALAAETGARALLWEAPPAPEAEAGAAARGLLSLTVETAAGGDPATVPARLEAGVAALEAAAEALGEGG